MSERKLFRFDGTNASEVPGTTLSSERALQRLIEGNMEAMLGAHFLASEYPVGDVYRGRVDSLGLDVRTGAPVIVEYKLGRGHGAVMQVLAYSAWLDRGDFERLVRKRLGAKLADAVDWREARLVCVAERFSRFDRAAVGQVGRCVELVGYRAFGDSLLSLESDTTGGGRGVGVHLDQAAERSQSRGETEGASRSLDASLARSSVSLLTLFWELDRVLTSFDGVQRESLKHYLAYRRHGGTFACVTVLAKSHTLVVYAKADLGEVELVSGFTRDVTSTGHLGTGNLEVRISCAADLERAVDLLRLSHGSA